MSADDTASRSPRNSVPAGPKRLDLIFNRIVVLFGVGLCLYWYLGGAPMFAKMFESFGGELPVKTRLVLSVWWPLCWAGVFLGIFAGTFAITTRAGSAILLTLTMLALAIFMGSTTFMLYLPIGGPLF